MPSTAARLPASNTGLSIHAAPFQPRPPGRVSRPSAMRETVQWLIAQFPDLRYDIEAIVTDGDLVVARVRARGEKPWSFEWVLAAQSASDPTTPRATRSELPTANSPSTGPTGTTGPPSFVAGVVTPPRSGRCSDTCGLRYRTCCVIDAWPSFNCPGLPRRLTFKPAPFIGVAVWIDGSAVRSRPVLGSPGHCGPCRRCTSGPRKRSVMHRTSCGEALSVRRRVSGPAAAPRQLGPWSSTTAPATPRSGGHRHRWMTAPPVNELSGCAEFRSSSEIRTHRSSLKSRCWPRRSRESDCRADLLCSGDLLPYLAGPIFD